MSGHHEEMAAASILDLLTRAAEVAAEHRRTVGDRPVQPDVAAADLAAAFGLPEEPRARRESVNSSLSIRRSFPRRCQAETLRHR